MKDVTTFDRLMKDMFPLPGQPVKEWVLKARAERAEIERTGKRVAVARIETGALPLCLASADWRNYNGCEVLEPTWPGWCRMWWGVAYVRLQGFDRDAGAIGGARE